MGIPLLKIIPNNTTISFLEKKMIAFTFSCVLVIASLVFVGTKSLNFGIDFTGGILIEAAFSPQPDIGTLRQNLNEINIGDISLQELSEKDTLLIRIGQQDGNEKERVAVIQLVKTTLEASYEAIDYRKVDYVGPKVGSELITSGSISLVLAFIAILIYVWFRFEWQFGVGAVIALIHDAILTLGFFSITQLEFNLSSIAAILTIIGYSINDSVVIYDRIRENLRKYKAMSLIALLNKSINDNLTRTILTSLTTLLALTALVFLGGDVLKSFSLAAFFGVIIGTYSSIYVAAPVLVYFGVEKLTGERA